MATVSEAIARIAAGTGTPEGVVFRMARALREDSPNLWPKSGQGGGKAAVHVEPVHLVNLIFAFAAPQPSDGAEIVNKMAVLRAGAGGSKTRRPPDWFLKERLPATHTRLLPGIVDLDLRARAVAYVAGIATAIAQGDAERLKAAKSAKLTITLTPDMPLGFVQWMETDSVGEAVEITASYFHPQGMLIGGFLDDSLPAARPMNSTRIPHELLEIAADLAADTMRRRASDLFSGPGPQGKDPPENKAPGPNGDRAPTTGQRPRTEPKTSHTGQTNGPANSTQSLSRRLVPPPSGNLWPQPETERFHDGPYPVAAAAL